MTLTRFLFGILLAASLCWTGCEMFASHTNPIAGWHSASLVDLQNNKAICDDYQAYIKSIPSRKFQFIEGVSFSEDGTGQHAVTIQEGRSDTYWNHVLVYDKDNKRIKVIVYVDGHYSGW